MENNFEFIFMSLLAISLSSLKKKIYFFIWVICHFIVWLKEVFFFFFLIIWVLNLYWVYGLQIFFPSLSCLSTFWWFLLNHIPIVIYFNLSVQTFSYFLSPWFLDGWKNLISLQSSKKADFDIFFNTLCFYWRSDFQRPLISEALNFRGPSHYSNGKI